MTLIEHIPSALVVPVTINNSWKMQRYGKFPLGIGNHLKFKVHKPLRVSDYKTADLIDLIEKQITDAIDYEQ